MDLFTTTAGEALIMGAGLSNAPHITSLSARLYQNIVPLVKNATLGLFKEVSFPGYSSVSLLSPPARTIRTDGTAAINWGATTWTVTPGVQQVDELTFTAGLPAGGSVFWAVYGRGIPASGFTGGFSSVPALNPASLCQRVALSMNSFPPLFALITFANSGPILIATHDAAQPNDTTFTVFVAVTGVNPNPRWSSLNTTPGVGPLTPDSTIEGLLLTDTAHTFPVAYSALPKQIQVLEPGQVVSVAFDLPWGC